MNKEKLSVRDYIQNLSAKGQYHFTTNEVQIALEVSHIAAKAALRRLNQKGEIASPYRAFYIIIPPEYKKLGCLPPEQFIPQLMEYINEQYYIALLSAAEIHGAAHHRPQQFQVMMRKNRRPIVCGRVRVQFFARHNIEDISTVEMNTPRGRMLVSSPESTAIDMVGYTNHSGGLDNVAIVLSELAEVIDPSKLLSAAEQAPIAWSQRLGYLLDLLNYTDKSHTLADYVHKNASVWAPLERTKPITGALRSNRWKLAINAKIEIDL